MTWQDRLLGLKVVRRGRDLVSNFREGLLLPDKAMTRALLQTPDVTSASVQTDPGGSRIDLERPGGSFDRFEVLPVRVMFSPRGGKEISFRVVDVTNRAAVLAYGAAIGELIAQQIWRFGSRGDSRHVGAHVDLTNKGTDPDTGHTIAELVVDLATTDTYRTAEKRLGPNALMETLLLESLTAAQGGFRYRLGVRGLGR